MVNCFVQSEIKLRIENEIPLSQVDPQCTMEGDSAQLKLAY